MSLAMDFAAMMKAERAKARGGAPAAPSAPQAASAIAASASSSSSPTDDYALPARADRPAFDAAQPLARAPPSVWHLPDWITPDEEASLTRCADGAPPERWTRLRGRRLQNLGGLPKPPPEGMHAEPLPPWVASVCDALVAAGVFDADAPPNHVLLNEYQPGQGIDAHRDGPLYAPRVAILSLCSHCAFEFLRNDAARDAVCSLLLPPRGVLVFSDDAYHELLHTVPAVAADDAPPPPPGVERIDLRAGGGGGPPPPRGRRLSLTVRRVLALSPKSAPPLALWERNAAVARFAGGREYEAPEWRASERARHEGSPE